MRPVLSSGAPGSSDSSTMRHRSSGTISLGLRSRGPYSSALNAPSATADVAIRVIIAVYAGGNIIVVAALHGRCHRVSLRTCHARLLERDEGGRLCRDGTHHADFPIDTLISVSVPSAVSATLDDT